MDYWTECIAEAFEDAGIAHTDAQLDTVVNWVEGAHDNYSQATGLDVASSNWHARQEREKQDLIKQIQIEKDKVHCKACNGSGEKVVDLGAHVGVSECWKCKGAGRHSP